MGILLLSLVHVGHTGIKQDTIIVERGQIRLTNGKCIVSAQTGRGTPPLCF